MKTTRYSEEQITSVNRRLASISALGLRRKLPEFTLEGVSFQPWMTWKA